MGEDPACPCEPPHSTCPCPAGILEGHNPPVPACPPACPLPLQAMSPMARHVSPPTVNQRFPRGQRGWIHPFSLCRNSVLYHLAGAPWCQCWGSALVLAAACSRQLCHPDCAMIGARIPKNRPGLDPALGSSMLCLHLRASPQETNLSPLQTSATGLYWVPGALSCITASSQVPAGPQTSVWSWPAKPPLR